MENVGNQRIKFTTVEKRLLISVKLCIFSVFVIRCSQYIFDNHENVTYSMFFLHRQKKNGKKLKSSFSATPSGTFYVFF